MGEDWCHSPLNTHTHSLKPSSVVLQAVAGGIVSGKFKECMGLALENKLPCDIAAALLKPSDSFL
jgi:hypothetical protein